MNNSEAQDIGRKPQCMTFFGFDQARKAQYDTIHRHNKIIDPSCQYRRLNADQFGDLIDPDWDFSNELRELYDQVTIDEVRGQLLRYAALYHYGGWYLDPEIFLVRVFGELDQIENLLILQSETKLVSQRVMKFTPRHPLLHDMLEAIVANSRNHIHLHDVTWFSGEKLLTAIASRNYYPKVRMLSYEDYVNYIGGVFQSLHDDRELPWPILQHFGVRKDVDPQFDDLPKRISYDEADIIMAHVKRYELHDAMEDLRKARPSYFREIQRLNKASS